MKIGIIGTGMIGSTVGKLWIKAGHYVQFAARDQGKLEALVNSLGAQASSGSVEEVIANSDTILFATPFGIWPDLVKTYGAALKGKVVIDAANPYPQRDGDVARKVIESGHGAGSYTASLLHGVHLVKAFNTLYFETLAKQSNRAGGRLGMAIAGDDHKALDLVAKLVGDAGFDAVQLPMSRSKDIDPGTPVYNQNMSASELRKSLNIPQAA